MHEQSMNAVIVSRKRRHREAARRVLASHPAVKSVSALADYPTASQLSDIIGSNPESVFFIDFTCWSSGSALATEISRSYPGARAVALSKNNSKLTSGLRAAGISEVVSLPLRGAELNELCFWLMHNSSAPVPSSSRAGTPSFDPGSCTLASELMSSLTSDRQFMFADIDLPASLRLLSTLNQHLASAGSASSSLYRQGLRLLVAEDSDDYFELFRYFTQEDHHSITRVSNGAQAVALQRSGKFDLIVMDVGLPVMDGYEAARAIREHEARDGAVSVPILLLSADDVDRQKHMAAIVGCSGVVTKPSTKAQIRVALSLHAVL